MPAGAAMTTEILIPTITSAQAATGEVSETYSYDGVAPIYGRFFETSQSPSNQSQGQYTVVEARVLIEYEDLQRFPVEAAGSGRRFQLKVNNILWEVLRMPDLGNVKRMVEITLKRWK